MDVPFLDLQAQYRRISGEVDAAIAGVVESQQFVLGERVDALEQAIADRVGVAHAIGCASGTDALLLSLKAMDLPEDAEVIVPAFTFFATAGAVWNAGYRPVFADIDPHTFNITAETIEAALTPRSRAVIVVHLFGQMADMAPILELAGRHDLDVIEDAAQSIDAAQPVGDDWKAAGSVGLTGCFSFFPTKNLGGFGDGGLITTGDDDLAERLRKLRVHGGRQMYHHEMVGTNSRLDALQAAVLSAKLPHLEAWNEERRANAERYDAALKVVTGILTPRTLPGSHHVYNQYTIRVEDRDEVRGRLAGAGIGTGVYYPVPLHLQACFSELGYGPGDLPESERAALEVLSLPIFPELTTEQQAFVIQELER